MLTALATRSKAVWGYDAAFMDAAAPDLLVTAEMIASGDVRVATRGDTILGFVTLAFDGEAAEITQLFVDPDCLGQGAGRRLVDDAFLRAARQGATRITVESDLNAAPFYQAAGMVQTGVAASIVDPRRKLPVLEKPLTAPE